MWIDDRTIRSISMKSCVILGRLTLPIIDDIGLGARVGQSRRAAKLDNIVHLFSERYKTLRRFHDDGVGFESHTIAEASRERKRCKTYHFIGMVMSTRRTN